MISQYSHPRHIDKEFWDDYRRASYWLNKTAAKRTERFKMIDGGWDVLNYRRKYSMSEVYYYTSPQTGNQWLTFMTAKRDKDGQLHVYARCVLYHLTEAYMTIMVPMTIVNGDDADEQDVLECVNVYTAHMFQRLHERLGVDMADRISVIRNFVEFVVEGWMDTRPPRAGERHQQIMLRAPASWFRGHIVNVGPRAVITYRTFYTDRTMSYQQLKDVRSFKRFADSKMNL